MVLTEANVLTSIFSSGSINNAEPSPKVRTRANTAPGGPAGSWRGLSQREARRGGGPGARPLGETARGCPRTSARSQPRWLRGAHGVHQHLTVPRTPSPPLQRAHPQGPNPASVQVLEAKWGAARPSGRAVAGAHS